MMGMKYLYLSMTRMTNERRPEVIDYVTEKYGKDHVVQIVTFGTMAARAVIRDVGRVLDLPYAFVDSVSKKIPTELGITIDKALKMNPELAQDYENDGQIKYLIDMSRKLEGSRSSRDYREQTTDAPMNAPQRSQAVIKRSESQGNRATCL